ncbi:MAG: caspase family protein [Magnetococcales bacterium]|nr:caspase family protein [Magnetococcales bacterium]
MKKALIVGIDHYDLGQSLTGCVNDAVEIALLLATNEDGSPNFSVRTVTSDKIRVTSSALQGEIEDLFSGNADTVLFYFAGHGILNQTTDAGFIVSQDGKKGAWGFPLNSLLQLANKEGSRIRSTVIILDSCNSGYMGEVSGLGNNGQVSVVGNGVTILTACHREEVADERNGHGLFTSILIDGLRGSSSDICGNITPASIYSHVDQILGPWEQRPIYKANVETFIVLRRVSPKIPLEFLRHLPNVFPDPAYIYQLNPSFEPERGEEADRLQHVPIIEKNVQLYRKLQACNRHGLVVPVNQPHMWHAAVFSTGCKLTALGVHYRKLAEMRRI